MSNFEKISFTDADNETVELYILEETRINGVNYLLVSESDDEESECYIFKDLSDAGDEEACYVEVEDDSELDAVFKVFEQLLDDTEIVK